MAEPQMALVGIIVSFGQRFDGTMPTRGQQLIGATQLSWTFSPTSLMATSKKLGLPLGDRKRLLKAIADFGGPPLVAPDPPAPIRLALRPRHRFRLSVVRSPSCSAISLSDVRLAATPNTWVEWSASQLLHNTPLHPIIEWVGYDLA
jgi:hypothetical protein